jgi:hypothetical protein
MIMACLNFRLLLQKPQTARRGTIAVEKSAFDQFVFSFPIPVEQGVSYDYYFEVFDNDAIHNFKRSHLFSNRVATDEENEDQIWNNK